MTNEIEAIEEIEDFMHPNILDSLYFFSFFSFEG